MPLSYDRYIHFKKPFTLCFASETLMNIRCNNQLDFSILFTQHCCARIVRRTITIRQRFEIRVALVGPRLANIFCCFFFRCIVSPCTNATHNKGCTDGKTGQATINRTNEGTMRLYVKRHIRIYVCIC